MATRISEAVGMFKAAAVGAPILASTECEKIPVTLFGGLFLLSRRIILRLHLVEKVKKTFGHLLVGCKNNLIVHLKNKASVFLIEELVIFGCFGVEFFPAGDPNSVLGDIDCIFCAGESACEHSCKDGQRCDKLFSNGSVPWRYDRDHTQLHLAKFFFWSCRR